MYPPPTHPFSPWASPLPPPPPHIWLLIVLNFVEFVSGGGDRVTSHVPNWPDLFCKTYASKTLQDRMSELFTNRTEHVVKKKKLNV